VEDILTWENMPQSPLWMPDKDHRIDIARRTFGVGSKSRRRAPCCGSSDSDLSSPQNGSSTSGERTEHHTDEAGLFKKNISKPEWRYIHDDTHLGSHGSHSDHPSHLHGTKHTAHRQREESPTLLSPRLALAKYASRYRIERPPMTLKAELADVGESTSSLSTPSSMPTAPLSPTNL
jgi:hypothetical protein